MSRFITSENSLKTTMTLAGVYTAKRGIASTIYRDWKAPQSIPSATPENVFAMIITHKRYYALLEIYTPVWRRVLNSDRIETCLGTSD